MRIPQKEKLDRDEKVCPGFEPGTNGVGALPVEPTRWRPAIVTWLKRHYHASNRTYTTSFGHCIAVGSQGFLVMVSYSQIIWKRR